MMDQIDRILSEFGSAKVDALRAMYELENINASGALSESTQFDLISTQKQSRLIVSALAYVFTIDTGRRPTRNFDGTFSQATIEQWIVDKRIRIPDSFNSLEDFAYVIWRKISEEGTKTFREGGRTILADTVSADLEELQSKLAEVVREEYIAIFQANAG